MLSWVPLPLSSKISLFCHSCPNSLMCLVSQSSPTLCDPMEGSPPGSSVHGILQARILEWVAFPFSNPGDPSSGSSQPRDQTQVFHIAGGFFTSWATREAQGYWSGYPIPSPADLPNPGIELESLALQADSLPNELSRKPLLTCCCCW